jgi:hypothetical protein
MRFMHLPLATIPTVYGPETNTSSSSSLARASLLVFGESNWAPVARRRFGVAASGRCGGWRRMVTTEREALFFVALLASITSLFEPKRARLQRPALLTLARGFIRALAGKQVARLGVLAICAALACIRTRPWRSFLWRMRSSRFVHCLRHGGWARLLSWFTLAPHSRCCSLAHSRISALV